MKSTRNFIQYLWNSLLSSASKRISLLLLWGLMILGILTLLKYVFITSCITVDNVKECVSSAVDSSSTLFAVGSIFVAILALVPIFWIDGKISDAKKDVSRNVLKDIQEKMKDMNKAQILIFEAEKYQSPTDLISRELLVEEGVRLWPPFQQEEHRKLGRSFSQAIINEFYQGFGGSMQAQAQIQGTVLNRDQIKSYLNKAIFYLEETILSSETSDREDLVNLACMYGCDNRYEAMIRVIERTIRIDENVRDDLQETKNISLLVRACGIEKRKIERLGKKIGKDLPLPKEEFIQVIKDVYAHTQGSNVVFFGIARQPNSQKYVYIVRITTYSNSDGYIEVGGQTFAEFELTDVQYIPERNNQPPSDWKMPIEDFFDKVNQLLMLICYKES